MRLYGLAVAASFGTALAAGAAGAASITSADLSLLPFVTVEDAPVGSNNTLLDVAGASIEVSLLTGSTFAIIFDATGSGLPNFSGGNVRFDDIRFDMPAVATGAELTSGTQDLIARIDVTDTSVSASFPEYIIVDNPAVPFFDARQE
ncbi:MAG: hypothetical protein AAGC57_06700 [Pseudomonadota bacterium]